MKDPDDIPTAGEPGPDEAPTVADSDPALAPTVADGDAADAPTIADDPLAGETTERGVARVIGNYRLLNLVGEGGMGEVYEAQQVHPVKRRVAFKVIKPGMDSKQIIARFESERQALALMDHSAIARVFDAGTTPRGRPFFVMEFVSGVPITQHCNEHQLGLRERLELFIQVCEGVQHAHQKAIIHRDLKPSNVLVTVQDGKAMPKIIDFGIAKATGDDVADEPGYTRVGQLLGTPEYMSPEQAEGQPIDTRTDVYALGVILYELLVGALPFDSAELRRGGFDGVRRLIREVAPPRPSTKVGARPLDDAGRTTHSLDPSGLARQLKGDLDWIVLKALEKDRARRYGSPSDFAADVRRYLDNEPVLASPPSTVYMVQKFVKRHTFGVASAAVVLVLLVSFAVTMAVQAGRIARERDRANQEAETATQVSDFLFGLFEISDPSEGAGNRITAREILDQGAARVRQELGTQPRLRARMMDVMGRVYRSLGLYGDARPLVEEALTILEQELGDDHLEFARTAENLGSLMLRTADFEAAGPLLERALEIRRRELGDDHRDVASAINNLGNLALRTGDYATARERYEQALAIFEGWPENEALNVAQTLNNLAIVSWRTGDRAGAREMYERSLHMMESVRGPEHIDTAQAVFNLATLVKATGDLEGALPLYERALAIREKALGPEHADVARTLNNLANLLDAMGDAAGARRAHERALAIREKAYGPDHPDVAQSLNNLAILNKTAGRYALAREQYERAITILEEALGPTHRRVALGYYNMASLEAVRGNRSDALGLLSEAVDRGFALDAIFDDDDLRSLRGDPRFESLVETVRQRLSKDES